MLTLDRPTAAPTPTDDLDVEVTLDDGSVVRFHPAQASDADDLHALYERLSPGSRRMRFFQAMPRVPVSIARHLCAVDPGRHEVWLARAGGPTGPVVGEVQAAIDPDDARRAEIALAVDDAWTGRGLGRSLVALVHRIAARRGIETFTAEVLAENRRCAALLIAAGMTFSVSAGVLEGSGPVRPWNATGRVSVTGVALTRGRRRR